jgi:hypothetical protein
MESSQCRSVIRIHLNARERLTASSESIRSVTPFSQPAVVSDPGEV